MFVPFAVANSRCRCDKNSWRHCPTSRTAPTDTAPTRFKSCVGTLEMQSTRVDIAPLRLVSWLSCEAPAVKVWMAKGHVSFVRRGRCILCTLNITDFRFIRWGFDLLVWRLKLSWLFCDWNLFSMFTGGCKQFCTGDWIFWYLEFVFAGATCGCSRNLFSLVLQAPAYEPPAAPATVHCWAMLGWSTKPTCACGCSGRSRCANLNRRWRIWANLCSAATRPCRSASTAERLGLWRIGRCKISS